MYPQKIPAYNSHVVSPEEWILVNKHQNRQTITNIQAHTQWEYREPTTIHTDMWKQPSSNYTNTCKHEYQITTWKQLNNNNQSIQAKTKCPLNKETTHVIPQTFFLVFLFIRGGIWMPNKLITWWWLRWMDEWMRWWVQEKETGQGCLWVTCKYWKIVLLRYLKMHVELWIIYWQVHIFNARLNQFSDKKNRSIGYWVKNQISHQELKLSRSWWLVWFLLNNQWNDFVSENWFECA